MKILVILNSLGSAGGVETSLLHKATAWVCNGYEVEVLTLNDSAPDFNEFPAGIRRASLGITYDSLRSLHSPRNLFVALKHARALRRWIRRVRPDVVINCIYGYSFYFLPLVSPASVKLVSENHSSRKWEAAIMASPMARAKSSVRKFFESFYDFSVFLSREEAEVVGGRNACVIPNFIQSLPLGIASSDKKNQVIAAGRICRVKGFDRLVEVWALLADKLPDWQLHIYGDGERQDVESLQALIAARRLQHCVHVHPATTAIHERIAESRIYAMTSRSECFPMVLLEAMQLGVPVVAYDCPTGPRNILRPGVTGILVEDGNAAMFAQSLLSLALDPQAQQSMGRAARDEARRYELEQVMPLWANVFGAARD